MASGRNRHIYQHPEDPHSVIKLPRPELPWSSRPYARLNYWRDCRREQIEYLRLAHFHRCLPEFVVGFRGYVDTDLGCGMVYEKAVGADGVIAPTLRQLLDAGPLDEGILQHLLDCYRAVLASPVVVGDLNAPNLVFCQSNSGERHFKIVDGLGDKKLLPIMRMSPVINAYRKRRRIRRNLRRIGYPQWRTF